MFLWCFTALADFGPFAIGLQSDCEKIQEKPLTPISGFSLIWHIVVVFQANCKRRSLPKLNKRFYRFRQHIQRSTNHIESTLKVLPLMYFLLFTHYLPSLSNFSKIAILM